MAVENGSSQQEVSEEVKDARLQVLSSNQVVQANLAAEEAEKEGTVVIGGTK